MSTSNKRIKTIEPISPPSDLLAALPIDDASSRLVDQTRSRISEILRGNDPRLLVVVGPCSIHDADAAMDYAERLLPLRDSLESSLEIVMRVYFEKPRTTIGWKGLINDPEINNTFNVDSGLTLARRLLRDLNALGMPAGTEFLDAVTGQYYADLISWGAIGARTTESQIHRELASGLSCPVGFKNGTNGNVDIAIDAVKAANTEHSFLSPTEAGTTALFRTSGNADAHIILRGGNTPNYDSASVANAKQALSGRDVETGLMIDFSHANSRKDYRRQVDVGQNVCEQLLAGETSIRGCMIESHIHPGNQAIRPKPELEYGVSITDACLGFADTAELLQRLAEAISQMPA